jgi:hypothetical protein
VNGTFPITVRVSDAGTQQQTATYTCNIIVTAALSVTAPCPATGSVQGLPYTFTVTASGGQGALTWQLTSGPLPPGLALNTTTGVISGTPTVCRHLPHHRAGHRFRNRRTPTNRHLYLQHHRYSDPEHSRTLSRHHRRPKAPRTPSQSPSTAAPVPSLTNSQKAPYPRDSPSTPTPAPSPERQPQAVPSPSPFRSETRAQARCSRPPRTSVTSSSLQDLPVTTPCPAPSAVEGRAYSLTLTAAGGAAPYTWALATGSTLPAGLTLNPSTGVDQRHTHRKWIVPNQLFRSLIHLAARYTRVKPQPTPVTS